jgi:hypothetical protein
VLVDRAATAQRPIRLELGLGFPGQERDEAVDLGHHLGADAVAGKQEQIVGCHGTPPWFVWMLEGIGVVLDRWKAGCKVRARARR